MTDLLNRYFAQGYGAFTPENKNFISDAVMDAVSGKGQVLRELVVREASNLAIQAERVEASKTAVEVMPARVDSWIDELIYRGWIVSDSGFISVRGAS